MGRCTSLKLALAGILFLGTTSQAALLTEAFDYTREGTAGLASRTGTLWTVDSTDDYLVASGNLSKTGFPASTGNMLQFGGTGPEATASFTSQTSGTVYFSTLISVSSVVANTAHFISLQPTTGSVFAAPIYIQQDPTDSTKFDFGIAHRTNNATRSFTSAKSTGTTYLLVASYTFVSGSTNDIVKMWVDPDASSFGGAEPAATVSLTNSATLDLTSIARIQLNQDTISSTPNITLDEIRVGTTWADVTSVPEPAIVLPFVLAGLCLNRRRISG
jgi:hypothetical protein